MKTSTIQTRVSKKLKAMQELLDIISDNIKSKSYDSFKDAKADFIAIAK